MANRSTKFPCESLPRRSRGKAEPAPKIKPAAPAGQGTERRAACAKAGHAPAPRFARHCPATKNAADSKRYDASGILAHCPENFQSEEEYTDARTTTAHRGGTGNLIISLPKNFRFFLGSFTRSPQALAGSFPDAFRIPSGLLPAPARPLPDIAIQNFSAFSRR